MSSYLNHPLIRPQAIQSRIYQQILYGVAIKDNSLIVLPTGLGKTVIFIMVIAHYLHKYPNSQVIITAPTRPLVTQHFESCIKMLHIDYEDVQIISGETSPAERKKLWNSGMIFIATPQTLRNDIIAKRLDLGSISLICFDEAHRAVGNDPYVLCAEQYAKHNSNGRRLGFTASPGNREKIFEIIDNLALNQFEYMDEDHPQVKPYIHDISENWIWVSLPPEFQEIINILNSLIKSHLTSLKEMGIIDSIVISKNPKRELLKIPSSLNNNRDELGDDKFFSGMSNYGQLMLLSQGSEMLETQGIHTFQRYIIDKEEEYKRTKKKSLGRLLFNQDIKNIMKITDQLIKEKRYHPKLERLLAIIGEQIKTSPESRILIFANYKATTNFLVDQLQEIPKVQAHRFVGQSSSSYGKGLSQKEQKRVMDQFRSGHYNVLVSTSVGEEGLDVAQCDLVVFYDVTPSATRLIQRSGRTGRAREGKVIILITKGTRDEGYFYVSKRKKSKIKSTIKDIKSELAAMKEKKQQTDLNSFFDKNEDIIEYKKKKEAFSSDTTPQFVSDKPVIYVDHRERGAGLMRKLLLEDVEVLQTSLPVGDFLLSSRVAIERKTVRDFRQTLIRGDLFDQLIKLKNTFIKPLLLVEGTDLFSGSMGKSAIMGALNSIIVDYNIPVIQTQNEEETIQRIISIAKREQEKSDRLPKIRSRSQTGSLYEAQLALLSTLPNINLILAERILKIFETPLDFLSASVDDMKKVYGVGPQIAQSIQSLVSSRADRN